MSCLVRYLEFHTPPPMTTTTTYFKTHKRKQKQSKVYPFPFLSPSSLSLISSTKPNNHKPYDTSNKISNTKKIVSLSLSLSLITEEQQDLQDLTMDGCFPLSLSLFLSLNLFQFKPICYIISISF